jgi:DNA-binding NtrC family response regulator
LKNILDRAVILAGGEPIDVGHIGIDDADLESASPGSTGVTKPLDETEKAQILEALKQSRGSKTEAARILGITRRKLYSRMKIHGIKL